jgi:lysophospholipase L1-like esterase
MKILNYIPLSIFFIFFISLVVHYFSLRGFFAENHKSEMDQFYTTGEWGRPDVVRALPLINKKTIVALGGSTLVVPGKCDGKDKFPGTFPELLNNEFKTNGLSVLNLGLCGEDSRGTLVAIDYILKTKRPAAFLLLLGHSDYSNVNRDLILSQTSLINTEFLMKKVFFFLPLGIKFQLDHFLKNTFEAGLIKIYRSVDHSLFNKNIFKNYSSMVSDHFETILQQIVLLCHEKHIPLILLTPAGNLLYPPVAADEEVMTAYNKGMKTKNIALLSEVSEEDYFGFDQRAKKMASVIINKQASKDVLVIDLNEDFLKKDTKFFSESFSDIFHLTEDGHKYVFHKIMSAGILKLVH